MTAWAIVLTRSQQEDTAERCLLMCGYRAYLPRYRRAMLPHGRRRTAAAAMRPVFPGLIFVQDWRGWPALPITGSTGLMMGPQNRIAEIPDPDVGVLMERERAGAFDQVRRPPGRGGIALPDLSPGDEVEVDIGDIVRGIFHEFSGRGQAVIEMVLFGRSTLVKARADTIRRAS